MDLVTVLIFALAALIGIGAAAYMLNRAWGDVPGRIGPTSRVPPAPQPQPRSTPADPEPLSLDDEPALPAGAPAADLIPITDERLRRLIGQALERGGSPHATYFVRHDDQLFLAAHRIADPTLRAQAVRIVQGVNSGDTSGLSMGEIVGLIQKLGR